MKMPCIFCLGVEVTEVNCPEDIGRLACEILNLESEDYLDIFLSSKYCFFCVDKMEEVGGLLRNMRDIQLDIQSRKILFRNNILNTHKTNGDKTHFYIQRTRIINGHFI